MLGNTKAARSEKNGLEMKKTGCLSGGAFNHLSFVEADSPE